MYFNVLYYSVMYRTVLQYIYKVDTDMYKAGKCLKTILHIWVTFFKVGKQRNMCHISSIIQNHLTPSSSNNLQKQSDPLIKETYPSHSMIKKVLVLS